MKRLDVIMTAYNAEKYINLAIESILCQDFRDFRFIILDDGSTDSTLSIIKSYEDKRIELVQPGKIGYYKAKHLLIEQCTAEYIAIMDADDIADKSRLGKQVRFLDQNADYGMVGCRANWIDENGKSLSNSIDFFETDAELKVILLFINPFVHTSVVIRRNILFKNKLNYKPIAGEDFDLWIRINKYSKSYNLNEFLLQYRIHPNNMCYSEWYQLSDGIREIIFNQLEMYFPGKYTGEEAYAHLGLADFTVKNKLQDIPLTAHWIKKLVELNAENKHFDSRILKQLLYERTLKKFLRLESYNFSVFKSLMEIKKELQPAMTFELRKKEMAILAFSIRGKRFVDL